MFRPLKLRSTVFLLLLLAGTYASHRLCLQPIFTMENYLQELAQDAVFQSHAGHVTGLWFLPARPLRLNTNE